jgi:UDP-N-acetylmuramoyl-L-alanyl-D-glutamate--2,6-diaminopimelate ligase
MVDVSSLKGLTQDSRAVEPGFLFAAFKGEQVDGRDYIPQAIEKGASVILADMDVQLPEAANAELVTSDNPRKAFAHMVAEFYGDQPKTIAAVTGTNGKTSVVHFTQQIWQTLGYKAASIGTLSGGMTTADSVTLHKKLKDLKGEGVTHLAMEASSHGLHQYRLDGVNVSAAGFTNLSRDHLDYHKDMDEYLAAKVRLFTEVLQGGGVSIINADIPEAQTLIGQIEGEVWTYGRKGEQLKLISVSPTPHGQSCEVSINNKSYRIELSLVGEFQLMNTLCALGLALAQGSVDQDKAVQALETIEGAKGRLQVIKGHPAGAAVYVDYAHTPDALGHVLNALRPHTENKLICLFGCGGDRDKGKRPQMGEIASNLADEVVVTDDNPRSENPSTIRSEILVAAPNASEIGDRREAIQKTIHSLTQGDVLVIAGKGHEQGQIFADRTDRFDDAEEAENAIQGL